MQKKEEIFIAERKPIYDENGEFLIPYDDGESENAYIRANEVEEMILACNGPNGLSQVILDWQYDNPDGTKEEFIKESHFSRRTVDNLW